MISSDLTKDVENSLKTAKGQLDSILSRLKDPKEAQNVLIQMKAVQGLINKAVVELLDDAYRKALAERISLAADQCPGNCGNQENFEKLIKMFPEIKPEDIPVQLMKVEKMNTELKRFISENNLDTPL